MIKLKLPKESYWITLGYGVKVKVKPCTSAVFYEAKAYMNAQVAEASSTFNQAKAIGQKANDCPDMDDATKREALADQMLIIGLALAGIIDWEGVLEADSDDKAPLVPEKIVELFSNFWVLSENFRQQYCGFQEIVEAEKNVSSSGPSGTMETEENIAKDAVEKKSSAPSKSADTTKQP